MFERIFSEEHKTGSGEKTEWECVGIKPEGGAGREWYGTTLLESSLISFVMTVGTSYTHLMCNCISQWLTLCFQYTHAPRCLDMTSDPL
jgi:hypothetical protein